MTYVKVQWIHDFQQEPILLQYELDNKWNEIRKFEVHKNDKLGYVCENKSVNGTFLSECELPELSMINEDAQFEGGEINEEEFESIWEKAKNNFLFILIMVILQDIQSPKSLLQKIYSLPVHECGGNARDRFFKSIT